MRRLLVMVAFLVVEHTFKGAQASALEAQGLISCGYWALEHGAQEL